MASLPPAAQPQPTRLSILSWALYDLANTTFSINIVSLYFSLWVVNQMGGADADYGYANSFSMALLFFTAPILGEDCGTINVSARTFDVAPESQDAAFSRP